MGSRMVLRGGGLLLAAVALLLGAAASASAAAPPAAARWTPVPFPTHETADNYKASCVSARACFVIGSQGTYGFMRYDGRHIHSLPAPDWNDAHSNLGGLACQSTRFCMMVGQNERQPAAAERWDGRRWTATPVPSPVPASAVHAGSALAQLTSVACPSTSMCVAVGGRLATTQHLGPGAGETATPIAARWDGEHWSAVQIPLRRGLLYSISCPSTITCTAVGGYLGGGAVALVLDGSRWSLATLPTAAGTTDDGPGSISCTAPGKCVAVGSARRPRVVDGKRKPGYLHSVVWEERAGRWSAQLLPVLHIRTSATAAYRQQELDAVSCPPGQPAGCVAVGSFSSAQSVANGGFSATIATHQVRQQPLTFDPEPDTISCPTSGFCLAAGDESIEALSRGGD